MPFQYRFAGPPLKRPSILKVWLNDEELEHIVLKYNRSQSKDECFLYLCSSVDPDLEASWTGTQAELTANISNDIFFIPEWNVRFQISARMSKVLNNSPVG